MNAEHVLEQMRRHRSIRRYRAEEPKEDDIERAVAAAQMAATSSNIQAYGLLRIRDVDTRSRLAELCGGQRQVREAGAFFVVCGELRRHRLVAEARGAPNVQNLECFLQIAIDAALFAQNLALAFESQDYGICYIGGLRNQLPEVDALLELPEGVLPFFGLCVGYPDEDPASRPRLAGRAVLFEERYPEDEQQRADIAEYDERMERYYEERGKPGYDWSGGIARVFARARREHLFDYYQSKGARLF